jgi:ribokinase
MRNFFTGNIVCMGSINADFVNNAKKMYTLDEAALLNDCPAVPGEKAGDEAAESLSQINHSLMEKLKNKGAQITKSMYSVNESSRASMIWVLDNGLNSVVFSANIKNKLSCEDFLEYSGLIMKGDVLLITKQIPEETLYYAIRMAKRKGVYVVVDPASVPKIKKMSTDIIRMIDIIIVNKMEIHALTGVKTNNIEDGKKAALALKDMGYKIPIINLGKPGYIAVIGGEAEHFSAMNADSAGCEADGDVFAGALALAIANNKSIWDAIVYASFSAALSNVRKEGASLPDEEAV